MMLKGIVEYFGPNKANYPCGYCKADKPDNSSYGLWAHEMDTGSYQILVDRAWRRSGKFCYKSALDKICCPAFAIRCEALDFKPSRSQRKVIKRFNDFIYRGIKPKSYAKEYREGSSSRTIEPQAVIKRQSSPTSSQPSKSLKNPSTNELPTATMTPTHETTNESGMKDKTRKAKFIRLQRRIDKVALQRKCSKEEALDMIKEKVKQRCQQSTKPYEEYFKKPDDVDEPAHDLKIKFVSTCNEEHVRTFQASHKLYEKYQVHVHHDDPSECTSKQFKRFLVDNPFKSRSFHKPTNPIPVPTSYGSYHMQYWLDNKLIVVAVLDVLSHSVSSVYLFYDPEYSFLSLGTYSALREILLVRDLYKINPSISYYYLGLYIHSCPKMNYKGKFHPSFLLCDQALTWHPIEKCKIKLQSHSYPRFEDDPNKVDEESVNIKDDEISILYSKQICSYAIYKQIAGDQDADEVYEYARLVGRTSAKKMLLYRKEQTEDAE